ncbi:MAG: DUF378 domain-containing protein [Alphaproteobacteria bacterium]|nr:DUF378 domain-containing protein [Alphaproteobacteria bacterium]
MFTKICFWIMVIGGLNWGLVGFFDFDLVALISGGMMALARVIYSLVGLATIWCAVEEITGGKKKEAR